MTWNSNEMSSEKTEKPTQRKLDKLRREGSISQSQEIHKLFYLIGFKFIISGIFYFGGWLKDFFYRITDFHNLNFGFVNIIKESVLLCMEITSVILIVAIILRCLAGWMQFRPLFSLAPLQFKLSNLSPAKNIKNIFSLAKFYSLISVLFLLLLFFICLFIFLFKLYEDLRTSIFYSMGTELSVFIFNIGRFLNIIIGITVFYCAVDYFIQRNTYIKKQKMSKQDVKDEYKESEGGEAKHHLRSMALSAVRGQSEGKCSSSRGSITEGDSVSKESRQRNMDVAEVADFLLVNPENYAVALNYDEQKKSLPVIVSKNKGQEVDILKKLFHKKGKPVINCSKLTSQIYFESNVNAEIPRKAIISVAKIYVFIKELDTSELAEREIFYTNDGLD